MRGNTNAGHMTGLLSERGHSSNGNEVRLPKGALSRITNEHRSVEILERERRRERRRIGTYLDIISVLLIVSLAAVW